MATTCPGVLYICNFGRTFLGPLSLFMPGRREGAFVRNNAFSLYYLYGHAPAQESCPAGHENYNFGSPFLGHYK